MTTQFRRLGDRRRFARRQSNEIIDARSPSVPWPFPIVSDLLMCGACGQRWHQNQTHVCPVRKK